MKIKQKQEALRLRIEEKLSLNDIAKITGLAKSTVSIVCKNYPLDKERIKEIYEKSNYQEWAKDKAKQRKIENKEKGRNLIKLNPKFRDLCFLYWGEGSKHKKCQAFKISNSDFYMIKYIVSVLKEVFPEKLIKGTAYVHIENNISDEVIYKYWEQILPINIYRQNTSRASQRKRVGMLPYGTMHIEIYSIEILHMLLGGIEYLKEL